MDTVFRTLINGKSIGKTLEVSANVCRCTLAVICPQGGGLVDSLHFASLYFEETVTRITRYPYSYVVMCDRKTSERICTRARVSGKVYVEQDQSEAMQNTQPCE